MTVTLSSYGKFLHFCLILLQMGLDIFVLSSKLWAITKTENTGKKLGHLLYIHTLWSKLVSLLTPKQRNMRQSNYTVKS